MERYIQRKKNDAVLHRNIPRDSTFHISRDKYNSSLNNTSPFVPRVPYSLPLRDHYLHSIINDAKKNIKNLSNESRSRNVYFSQIGTDRIPKSPINASTFYQHPSASTVSIPFYNTTVSEVKIYAHDLRTVMAVTSGIKFSLINPTFIQATKNVVQVRYEIPRNLNKFRSTSDLTESYYNYLKIANARLFSLSQANQLKVDMEYNVMKAKSFELTETVKEEVKNFKIVTDRSLIRSKKDALIYSPYCKFCNTKHGSSLKCITASEPASPNFEMWTQQMQELKTIEKYQHNEYDEYKDLNSDVVVNKAILSYEAEDNLDELLSQMQIKLNNAINRSMDALGVSSVEDDGNFLNKLVDTTNELVDATASAAKINNIPTAKVSEVKFDKTDYLIKENTRNIEALENRINSKINDILETPTTAEASEVKFDKSKLITEKSKDITKIKTTDVAQENEVKSVIVGNVVEIKSLPVDTIALPVEKTSAQAKITTSVAVEATSLPVETASAQAETTSLPVETTSSQAETTSLPVEATSSPAETTSPSVETTSTVPPHVLVWVRTYQPEITTSVAVEKSLPVETESAQAETTSAQAEITTSVVVEEKAPSVEAASAQDETTSPPVDTASTQNKIMTSESVAAEAVSPTQQINEKDELIARLMKENEEKDNMIKEQSKKLEVLQTKDKEQNQLNEEKKDVAVVAEELLGELRELMEL